MIARMIGSMVLVIQATMPDPDPRLQGLFGWDGRTGDQPRFTTVVSAPFLHVQVQVLILILKAQ